MKKIVSVLAAAFVLSAAFTPAFAASPLDALTGIATALTSSSKFDVADLNGTWDYQNPAINFKSDNALNKIGGTAASVALVNKLKPYYEQIGLNTLSVTFDAEANFTMKIKGVQLKGAVTKDDENGNLTFNFNAFNKIPLGKVSAKAEKSATGVLSLTFDVSRLVTIVDKVSSVAKISSVQSLVKLLQSYEGIYVGAQLKKVKGSESPTTGTTSSTSTQTSGESTTTSGSSSSLGESLSGAINAIKNKTNK